MSNFELLRKIERIENTYNLAKEIAISFGANPESFAETDSNLAQLKKLAKDKVAGGVVANPGADELNFEIFS